MKTRHGFVSNSSSSSFIVAFPNDMEVTTDNVQEYLFSDRKYITAYDDVIDVEDATSRIYDDMQAQTPNDNERLLSFMGGWLEGAPDYDDFRKAGKLECDWDAYRAAADKYRAEYLKKFIADAGPNMNLYAFEFSDNGGDSILEHGDTFDRVNHIRISNH